MSSLYLTTRADRFGRRRMLVIGAALMAAAGVAFAFTHQFWLLGRRRHDRCHQSERQRGWAVPVDRTGGTVAGHPCWRTNGRVRVVHARGIDRHGSRRPRRRVSHPCAAAALGARRQLSRSRRGVRVHRRGALALVPESLPAIEAPPAGQAAARRRRLPASQGSTGRAASCSGSPASSRWTRSAEGSSSRACCLLVLLRFGVDPKRWAPCSSRPTCSRECQRCSPRASRAHRPGEHDGGRRTCRRTSC